MKNKNLLNWLWTDSHEKQSPQRFRRYAVMLMMLLTLGVGQMWAYTAHFSLMGDPMDNSWAKDTKYMINTGTGTTDEWFIYAYVAKNQYFALNNGSNQYGPGTNGSTIKNGSGGGQGSYNTNSWKFTGTSGIVKICCAESSNREWYPYVWVDETAPTIKFKHPWNGGSWTEQTATKQADGTYRYKGQYGGTAGFNAGYSSNFKYNSSATTVTGSPASGDYCYFIWNPVGYVRGTQDYDNGNTQSEHCGTFTIVKLCGLTYDGNGRTGGATVPSALSDQKYGTTITLSSAAMTKTGYTLTGWNTANDGSGTHYDLGASFTFSDKSNTLYAEWTQTITVDKNTGTSAGSMSICFNAGSLKSFTAATKTDWILDSYWTTADESGSKVIEYDASTGTASLVSSLSGYITTGKWTRTTTTKLYAHWKQTYRVTYYANYPASATSTGGSVPTDATEYASGATVTVKSNSGSLSAGGYTFAGWNTQEDGQGTNYTAGSGTFSISEPTNLYAKWTENKRDVTISAGTGGSVNKTSASVGVATTTTVTATAYPGYRFTGWTATNCSVASTSSASTTLSGNGTAGSGTLVANFARTYAYIEGRMTVYNAARSTETHVGSSKGKWSESSFNIAMDYDATNHRFYRHTYKTPAELSATQTDGTAQSQWFSIARSNASGSWSGKTTYHPSSNTDLTTAGIGQKKAAQTSTTTANYKFNSSATDGYAILYFDEAGVWYELEHTLKYDGNGNTGGSAPAATTYYNDGTNATAASNSYTMTRYSFAGWNTNQYITGTTYAVGASVPMTTNRTLYAIWTRSVTLEQEDATTEGSTSFIGKYNCATLPTITNPAKNGYEFGGWYTEEAGNGSFVINTSGVLQAGKYHWTDADGRFVRNTGSEDKPLYAKWIQTVTLNVNTANHGSGSNKSATIVYKATDKSSITHCTPATGYHLEGYYTAATDGVKVLNADGSFASSAVTDYITDGKWTKADATTLYAHYEPNTYDVILDVNGATTGSNQTVVATFDAAMPTTQKTSGDAITAPSKTGYTFGGYYANNTGTGTQYYTNALASNHIWDVATNNTHIYAKWTANPYTITLTQSGETGYGSAGTASVTATYDAVLPTISSLPTAANGYAFMGYYTDHNGEGTQYYDATGTKLVASYTTADALELFAYFKKAEITDVELNETMFDPVAAGDEGYVVANPTIAPNPTGDHIICWELLYDNDNPVTGHDAIADPDGSHLNRIKFSIAGLAAGGYKIRTTLRTGSSCAGGTLLDTRITTFQIANAFTVTVEYKDSEGNTIAASTTSPGKALEPTDITAPDLIGYTFSTWQLGEGMSAEDPLTTKTDFSYTTTFNSTLTAEYTKKNVIYFNNTLGWEDVWVYFYTSNKYWADNYGTGAWRGQYFNGSRPYYDMHRGHMTQIEGTNIWYFDYTAKGWDGWENVAFTNMGDQTGQGASADAQAPDNDHAYFSNTTDNPIQVVRRGDHKTTLPMFVPLTGQTGTLLNNKKANYVNQGYWMNYPENTGYVLHIYNSKTYGVADELMSIPFEYTADKTMPMSLTVELAGGKEYGFEIRRADSKKYGTDTKVMKNGDSGDDGAGWALAENQRTGLLTSVAGDYTFTLNFGNSGGYNFLAGVHYPVAANDYRVVYNDRVAWSLGSAHDASWYHPSRAIEKKDGAEDIVSFYVSKEVGASASMKFQYASSVSGEGVVTWRDVDGGSISLRDITESGVYNFYLSQAAGSITVDSIRPYTGQYYIRSQAVTGGWDNYRVGSDHKMTYSEFSESAANTFGEKFSHYKAKWCPRNTNIAFTIANDYSMCITDTLKQDVGNPYSNTDAEGTLNNDGNDGHSGSQAYLDPNSANVRFMWNRKTNKISRAYVASSTSTEARFLVLQGSGTANANIFDENGNALSANPPGANATLLRDDQNWIYEITVQANPSALVKLYATYKGTRQYFRGTSDDGFEKGTSAVELLGGTSSSSKYSVRVVYDFKTNRLVTAWQPTGATQEINGTLNINADVMVVRSHHESAQCITFANDESALTGVKTVYGVMQFNRWILNNREHPEDDTPEHCADASAIASYHRPLAIEDQKSIYERSHYYISFPFDVKLSDVFGFGQYWNEWYIEWYDGLTRAQNGYWIDSPSNWKYVTPEEKDNFVLKANQGYILGLDMDYMQATDFSFWSNKNTTIELYFPSTVSLETLKSTEVTIPALNTIEGDPYRCTINRENGDDGDRRIKDSYWRCIGVPSFNIYNSALKDGKGNMIEWKDNYEWKEDDAAFPFIYLWNKADNTITPQATSEFSFQPMHAYLVQNGGAIVWSAVSAKPSSIVARQRNTEPEEYNWRLELQQNNQMIDRTYIRMKDLESVTDGFDFGQDMSKEFNKKRSAIFSFIGTEKVAANSMPVHTDQTTIVPLGLDIKSAGEYVISLPEGTNGVGVVLVDSITGTRTNLGLMDYEVSLTAGKIDNRFFLEISPIVQTPTDIENVQGDNVQGTKVRKVMVDGILYIVKDGKVFDARGAKVK